MHSIFTQLFFASCLLISGLQEVQAQSQAKFNLKTGFFAERFMDEKETNADLWHIDHRYGFDIFVTKYRLSYIPGFHYHRMSVEKFEDVYGDQYFDKRLNYHIIRIPMSMGYSVADRGIVNFTVYGGGNVNFVLEIDENSAGINTEHLHDIYCGLQVGVQLSVSILTVEFQFDHALTKLLLDRPGSKPRGLGLSLGLKI